MSENPLQDYVTNEPTQHAFILSGNQTPFLTHMTMMHMEAHAYQLVLRARLPHHVMEMVRADTKAHPTSTYFLGNAAYDLMTLPELATGARVSFLGTLYRDIPDKDIYHCWPWSDETPLMTGVPVTIERVVMYRHFDFNLLQPTNLSYFLFGSGSEAHMTNFQVREPAFHHVATLEHPPEWLSPRLLEAGVPIEICQRPGTAVYCKPPFRTGAVRVRYAGQGPKRTIRVSRHPWFLTKVVNRTDPCADCADEGRGADEYWQESIEA